jgi:GDP-D-mannose 3', 5'-epimerase
VVRPYAVVLGGGGFIGANLCRRLVADGFEVRAVDVEFHEWRDPGCPHRKLDLRSFEATVHAVEGAAWVFHLAADMGGVGYFHSDADWGAAVTNQQISLNVLRAVQPDQRLFYSSSACSYPIEGQMVVGAPPKLSEDRIGYGTPDALYGAEKLQTLRLCSKMPNARVGVLHTVYGPLQEHEGRRMKFPAAVATKAIAARDSGRLELWGDGSQMRSYLFIDDAVEKIMRIMSADEYRGPVNIGAHGAATCRWVAEMALRIAGAEGAEIVTNPAEPSGVMARDCDNAQFAATYGDVPQTSLEDGFAKFIDWLDRPTTATRTPPHRAVMPAPERR